MKQRKCQVCGAFRQKGKIEHLPNCAFANWDEIHKNDTSQKMNKKSKRNEQLDSYLTQKAAKKLGHPSLAGAKQNWSSAPPKGLVKIEYTGRFEMKKSKH